MKGKLTQNKVHLQDHEYITVKLFLDMGYDVELIPKSQIAKYRQPDIIMGGLAWELKAPIGNAKYTIQNTIQDAAKQSRNVIIDLRRCKMEEDKAICGFKREFDHSKHLRRMKIIKKNVEILDYTK